MKKIKDLKSEIRNYVLEASLSDSDTIADNTPIFESGLLDSMGLLFLIEFLKENFDIDVSDHELNNDNFRSIETISDFVSSKKRISVES